MAQIGDQLYTFGGEYLYGKFETTGTETFAFNTSGKKNNPLPFFMAKLKLDLF